jgi:predicted enzyme related to lactoylglutathione lyase
MISGPSYVIYHVSDLPAARRFYTETLGYSVEGESPAFVQFESRGGATLALGTEDQGAPIEVWWFVDDADAACTDLRAKGAEVVTPPHDEPFGRAFEIRDPGGNHVRLLQLPAGGQ